MDKLERRLARLWRRMRGEKRRERRSKTKGESSPQTNRGEVTSNSNNKQRQENSKEQKDVVATTVRRTHSKHEERDLNNFKSPRRSHSRNAHDEKDLKPSLRRNHSKHEDRDASGMLVRRSHSKHSEKDLQNSQNAKHKAEKDLPVRHDPSKQEKTEALNSTQYQSSQDVSRALIRLYAFARLKSLQTAIVAGGSPSSGRSITSKHDDFESFKPLERNSFLSSLPQLSINRLESRDFDKTCLSHDSGYLTGSPRDFSSSTETLRQSKSPSVRSPRKREENEALAYKRRFHASHGDILTTTGAISSSTQKLDTIETFLSRNVYKSKCVTSLFEAAYAGLDALIDDVLAEFNRWFVGRKMLVVASELHFSVPLAKRSRKLEQILKQQMLRSLLENNRRILYLRGRGGVLPLHMAEARTEENIYSDLKLQAVQGVYQRCYYKLLPFVHSATPTWHAPYWKLSEPPVVPKKSAFQLDDHSKLRTHSFISFNIIGLSIFGIGHQSQDVLA